MLPCSVYHVDLDYLIEAGRMEGALVDSVSLDKILNNELEKYIHLIYFRLYILVSLKGRPYFFFTKKGIIFYIELPFHIAHRRGGIADGS